MTKSIAIVGGGYLGAELAKTLDETADVTLIEPRSHFVHSPAMIRAAVDPSILDRALIPYDSLLKRGKVLRARATGIDETGVTLADGARVEADYVVVATGSGNGSAFKPESDDIDVFRAENARIHGLLNDASSIAIVGAGPVGVELAGEIAHFMPDKTVTVISADAKLFPDFPPKLGAGLQAKLKAAGVEVVLGRRAVDLKSQSEPFAGPLVLDNGRSIDADLVIPAIGSRASSDLLRDLPGAEFDSAGRVKVDRWMRPSPLPNVFAAGDVADNGDAMTIVAVSRQLPWLRKTLQALASGTKLETIKPYTPWSKVPILIPLGPKRGNSFLVIATFGDFITRKMKGEDLFLTKYNKLLGRS